MRAVKHTGLILACLVSVTLQANDEIFSETPNFCRCYWECRAAFLSAVVDSKEEQQLEFKHERHSVPSKDGTALDIDTVIYPAKIKPKNLVIMVSGVHGVEGPAGSSLQTLFIQRNLAKTKKSNTGYLFVHAINPWGFAHGRRVTENNVDLNRNFGVSEEIFKTKNVGYANVEKILNPLGKVTLDDLRLESLLLQITPILVTGKFKTYAKQAVSGQYEFPKGLWYGGTDFEFQRDWLKKMLLDTSKDYKRVLFLDLHTGYGEPGNLHLIPDANAKVKPLREKVFGGHGMEAIDDEAEFYVNSGDSITFVDSVFQDANKTSVSMTLEFGTTGNLSIDGALESLRRARLENQAYFYGVEEDRFKPRIEEDYRELFYPDRETWRRSVADRFRVWVPEFIERFESL